MYTKQSINNGVRRNGSFVVQLNGQQIYYSKPQKNKYLGIGEYLQSMNISFSEIFKFLVYMLIGAFLYGFVVYTYRAPSLNQLAIPYRIQIKSASHPVHSISFNLNNNTQSQFTNLVIVNCHALYIGHDFSNYLNRSVWRLFEYQQVDGQVESFIAHMQLGLENLQERNDSILIFSGGQTKDFSRSEAQGYYGVADANGWFGHQDIKHRVYTEDNARDSLENVLFSLCRFYEITGNYPQNVTIIGYDFKQHRIVDLHTSLAFNFPLERVKYIGTPALHSEAAKGEEVTVKMFEQDPYGCHSPLIEKRFTRDPLFVGPIDSDSCPQMKGLMNHCSRSIYKGKLPWN